MVAATQSRATCGSPALPAKTAVSPAISPAAACNASIFLDVSITFAPAADMVAAMAFPIPRDAPVTSATLPSNEICMPTT